MTDRFCGIGGNDGNSGLTWALRKLTLNGVEDTPVVAGDTVYVGPGVYRETLTVDVDGTSGAGVITYIGDVTGENTDGIGGRVRLTASDDDLTATRTRCMIATGMDYRTFRGFWFDSASTALVLWTTGTNIIFEDCIFGPVSGSATEALEIAGVQSNWTIRRCIFFIISSDSIRFTHSVVVDDATNLVENCLFIGSGMTSARRGISSTRVGGIIIKNCSFLGMGDTAIEVTTALTVAQTLTVNNCIFLSCVTAVQATTTAEFVEDYNTFYSNLTDRTNVSIGANSVAQNPMFEPPPPLLDEYSLWRGISWTLGLLNENSSFLGKTGTGTAADDLFGQTRPATAAKISWGAVQSGVVDEKSTTQVNEGTYSFEMSDAGKETFQKPVAPSVEVTISVNVYREANYAGTAPQLIIREPGQADVTLTDAGAAATWNELTSTFTPQSTTTFIELILVSNNTAVAGSYAIYFDELT